MATDITKKKEFFTVEPGGVLADIVIRELSTDHSRSKILVTLPEGAPLGTVLELTGDTWAIATAGTGRLGILTHNAPAFAHAQEVGVVDADAVAVADALIIDKDILAAATETFLAQRVKLV